VLDRERLHLVAPFRLRHELFDRDVGPPARHLGVRADLREVGRVLAPQRAQPNELSLQRRHDGDHRNVKKRVDVLLVERGLAESRTQAQALVLAGRVPGHEKPGEQVDEAAELEVTGGEPYVSRGGVKLAHALDAFGIDPAGRDCLDVGASTGGFTDALLQRGAARVIALDVGYGQLHPRIREDQRVVVLERTNARHLTQLPFRPGLVVCDVSFISVRKALPPVLELAAPDWEAVVLVKPQFEAGRGEARGGVVRDPGTRRRVVREVAEAALAWGAETAGVVDSGLPGPKGNRELFLHLVQRSDPRLPAELDAWIGDAVT
jgi:23S rRNA (cytidine1920-2'-O)/16S rRNA (cytidine1409-2'-O)-methyltransferase